MKTTQFSLKRYAIFSGLISSLFFFSCSKEDDLSFSNASNSSNSTTSTAGNITPMLTLQDFMVEGSLTPNTNPELEPNATAYGYEVFDWLPSSGISTPTEVYYLNPSHPEAGNPLPPNSPLGGWEGTYYKETKGPVTCYFCDGPDKNCKVVTKKNGETVIRKKIFTTAEDVSGVL